MRLVVNLRNVKKMNRIMNDMDLLKYMKETAEILHELRLEVAMLREMIRGKAVSGKFLTMAEACEYLKISRATMTKRLADGDITFASKRGKSWLFPEDKLRAYASGMA